MTATKLLVLLFLGSFIDDLRVTGVAVSGRKLSGVDVDTGGLAIGLASVNAQPTKEDFESRRTADREAWAKQGGEGRKRALKASYGSASGSVTAYTSNPTSSSLKVQPTGLNCLIQSSSSATADCSNNLAFVVPACCSSSSETSSTNCMSWDNAQNIICANATTPYPSCCEFRDQPKSACNIQTSFVECGGAKPGVGCCGSSTCSINVDGSGGTCSTSSVGCCPA